MSERTLTASRLRELVVLVDGDLRWRKLERNRRPGPIGTTSAKGYRVAKVDRRSYGVHRLVWLYHHGAWPDGELDHIDADKLNNDISNLRIATRSENMQNLAGRGTAFKPNRKVKQWEARIYDRGRAIHIGSFLTEQEAHDAYLAAKRRRHAAFATGSGRG